MVGIKKQIKMVLTSGDSLIFKMGLKDAYKGKKEAAKRAIALKGFKRNNDTK